MRYVIRWEVNNRRLLGDGLFLSSVSVLLFASPTVLGGSRGLDMGTIATAAWLVASVLEMGSKGRLTAPYAGVWLVNLCCLSVGYAANIAWQFGLAASLTLLAVITLAGLGLAYGAPRRIALPVIGIYVLQGAYLCGAFMVATLLRH